MVLIVESTEGSAPAVAASGGGQFDLCSEPWLPLRDRESGTVGQVGLATALLDAHLYAGLAVELPTQVPALMRQVLLPVTLDALGSPRDRASWEVRFARGRFSEGEREALRAYLEQHADRFSLFSEVAPFAQAPGLRQSNGETKGSALLVPTVATGNNVPLFSSRTEGDVLELTPAEAVRWLLHVQCWDTAAIKSGAAGDPAVRNNKTTGNPTGSLGQLGVVMPMGRTLYETLLLNTPLAAQAKLGVPRWREEPTGPTWETRSARGLLDMWTWQSRRIRLLPEATPRGVRVSRVVLCAGDRLPEPPPEEPHTIWHWVKDAKSPGGLRRRPRRHGSGWAWRGLDALLALDRAGDQHEKHESSPLLMQLVEVRGGDALPDTYPLRVATYGISYGNQSAVIENLVHDVIPLPVASLAADESVHGRLLDLTDQADRLAYAVNRLSDDVRRAAGLDPIPWDRGQRPGERLLHSLDPYVRRYLAGAQRVGEGEGLLDRGQEAWETVAWRQAEKAADDVLRTASPQAFAGREVEQAGRNGRPVLFSLGTAEAQFRRRLREILPREADARRDRAMAGRAAVAEGA